MELSQLRGLPHAKGGRFMYRILKIGMDVHSTNYTLCAVESRLGTEDHVLANIDIGPDYKLIVDFIKNNQTEDGSWQQG